MEEWQKKHIQKNLVELCKATNCCAQLISRLVAVNVLNSKDKDKLEIPNISQFEKSGRLYDIIQFKCGSFDILIEALEKTRQTEALKILKHQKSSFQYYRSISYDKNHLLGTGYSGSKVFKGSCGGRDVAVKIINAEFIDLAVTLHEIKSLRSVPTHENVASYFAAESNQNIIYIAMELSFITLANEIQEAILKLDPIYILEKCVRGLGHLHKHSTIHRNLKPTNILISRDNQVKISDYSLSNKISVCKAGGGKGTKIKVASDWMPPEVLKQPDTGAIELVDMAPSVDIFSLGCIFAFVLTKGSHPFGDDVSTREENILNYKPLTKSLISLDNEWGQLVDKMISQKPSERPSGRDILLSNCFRAVHQ